MKAFVTGCSGFIGTHLVDALRKAGHTVVNFDAHAPAKDDQRDAWVRGDILDAPAVAAAVRAAAPEIVLHLAARTDCDENTTVEAGYRVNTDGTRNILDAVKAAGTVRRFVLVSSQFVCGPGRLPAHDEDFFPATVYGQSKVIAEQFTRAAGLSCAWTIVRPTNIWGPYHARYAKEFWRVLERGWYIHPDVPMPTRSYGYVGNVVWQILRVLDLPADRVNGRVLYVGDPARPIIGWIEGFHRAITGREMRRIPYGLLKFVARVGDGITRLTGRTFYITTSRLRSMTTDYDVPMKPTIDLLGEAPYTLEQGIAETVAWFRAAAPSRRSR